MFDHGQVVYLQIPAKDVATSARFYQRVLGWQIDPPESGFEAPGIIGQWVTDRPPAPDAGPLLWIHVSDVAETLAEAERAGAIPRQSPTPDGPRVLGSFSDPAGNLVGVAAHGRHPPLVTAGDDRHERVTAAPADSGLNRTMPACTIIPQLVYDDVTEAGRWLCHVFGLTERWHVGDHRAQLSFGTGTVAITEPRTSRAQTGHVSLVVRVDDAEAHWRRARARGANIVAEPRDFPYGERQYTAEDLGGHHWCFSQSIADVAPEDWGGISGPALRTASAPAATQISLMLIVPDGDAAVAWYRRALGAEVLWDLGGVAGLQIGDAAFFLHEVNPSNPAEDSPDRVGQTSTRVELFVADPDAVIERAVAAGATPGSHVTAREMPWGTHRQGGFHDPFGHKWSVGDASPLRAAG